MSWVLEMQQRAGGIGRRRGVLHGDAPRHSVMKDREMSILEINAWCRPLRIRENAEYHQKCDAFFCLRGDLQGRQPAVSRCSPNLARMGRRNMWGRQNRLD